MEEIRNFLVIPIPKDDVNHVRMVFRVSKFGRYPGILRIEMAEANLERKAEKILSIREAGVVLEYRGTQLVRHRCQTTGTLLPLGQVEQHAWEEIASRVGGADG